jgi:hypothetical protein
MRMDKILSKLHVKDNNQVENMNVNDLMDFVARIDVKFDTIESKMNSLEQFMK